MLGGTLQGCVGEHEHGIGAADGCGVLLVESGGRQIRAQVDVVVPTIGDRSPGQGRRRGIGSSAGADTPARFGQQRGVHVPDVSGPPAPAFERHPVSDVQARPQPSPFGSGRKTSFRHLGGRAREPRPPGSRQHAHLVLWAPGSRVTVAWSGAAWHISARAPKRGRDDAEDVVRGVAGRLEQQSALDGAASKVGSRW